MTRKHKIWIIAILCLFGFVTYETIQHKKDITKFIVKTILEHKKENAFEFVNKFVSVVPNYATKDGFEIVSKDEFEKYQQGYCLSENRILDKEELYKRAIGEYFKKKLLIAKEYRKILKNNHKYGYTNEAIDKIGYYITDAFNSSNWYEYLTKNFDENKTYIEITNAKKIDNPVDYLMFDLKNDIVGFKMPIIWQNIGGGYLYLDKFLFNNNHVAYLSILLIDNRKLTEHEKGLYDTHIKERRIQKRNLSKLDGSFDNCGNTMANIEQAIKDNVLAVLKGG
ncbi:MULTISPECIES: hypothetical protein [unclassified Campylobacter]|uniref:hypothetical protein n=1 Tax=unclassified Campylobacter TaxID=2593542 RepID=UPI0022E9AAFB|nr:MULTISPECIES: hypothetical protein [unclassified Campylobacter]MDA3042752.1 hypothetical protein [Campylobacter sp. JMF_09 ED2]MDA3063759.1 hypothetical protein [Campylobacter sp. JMF_11 EL3]MDA3071388.1 hypothetical protein [Campylobacter sp. VBCF_03 NA9]MDA3074848.1 hypothetical protein [Campylobacter sp. JMF_05 ED3]